MYISTEYVCIICMLVGYVRVKASGPSEPPPCRLTDRAKIQTKPKNPRQQRPKPPQDQPKGLRDVASDDSTGRSKGSPYV